MGSDKNAHQSHQLLTHAKGCDSHRGFALLVAIWASVRWHGSNTHAAALPTRLFADCVPFVHPLYSMGSVKSCMRHTRSKQGWGQPWSLQSLQKTRQSNGGEEQRQKVGMCHWENAWFHQLKTVLFQVIIQCKTLKRKSYEAETEFQLPFISPWFSSLKCSRLFPAWVTCAGLITALR